jgi:aspartate kinase
VIVMKFGGTSLENAEAMKRAVDIVARERERAPLVVLSAIAGATDTLLRLADTALSGNTRAAQEVLTELTSRHRWILFDLGLPREQQRDLAEAIARQAEELENFVRGVVLLRELSPRTRDSFACHGERLSSLLFSAAAEARGLPVALVDAREVVVTDATFGKARPDLELLTLHAQEKLGSMLAGGRIPITQGFVGATRDGTATTLGRGGSDYTAALLGRALSAEEIQIWTDVDGMLTADHRLVPEGMKIRELSFAEAAELAYFGAKVLHPSTIEPAMARDIPVRILNSRRPASPGTTITAASRKTGVAVKSIAAKKGITVVHVHSLRMLMAHGFLRAIFEVFDRHQTPVDLVATSEVSVSLTVERVEALPPIVEELSRFSQVTVESGNAIVCLVGEEIRSTAGIAARAFGALPGINVRLISQGASEINLSFVIREEDVAEAVRSLHREFFQGLDRPEVFEPVSVSSPG